MLMFYTIGTFELKFVKAVYNALKCNITNELLHSQLCKGYRKTFIRHYSNFPEVINVFSSGYFPSYHPFN